MVGMEVTAGGCADIGSTPEVHVTVISNERGAREIAMETFPGMCLPEATPETDH